MDALCVGVWVLGSAYVDGRRRLSPRDRVVLGALVLSRDRSVSPDRLADALWGETVPESARKVVQGTVMRLRKALGYGAIETSETGYRLALPGDDVDAWRFVDLVAQAGRLLDDDLLCDAVRTFDEALGLWRDDPLTDLERWPLAAGELARLRQLHAVAEERRLEVLVDLDRHDEVVAMGTRLTVDDPFRERSWELLAIALYRSGRQVEALRTLDRARCSLQDELVFGPGSALTDLEQAIRRQDPALTEPVRRPSRCRRDGARPGPRQRAGGPHRP